MSIRLSVNESLSSSIILTITSNDIRQDSLFVILRKSIVKTLKKRLFRQYTLIR